MNELIQRHRYFLVAVALLLCWGWLLVFFSEEKGEYLLRLRAYRSAWGDAVFPYVTLLGEGWGFGLAAIVVIAARRWCWLLGGAAAGGAAALAAALSKWYFSAPRPKLYFEQQARAELVSHIEGVELAASATTSLPSGHTLAAAAIYLFLALMLPPMRFVWLQLLLLLLVVAVAFSRLYLFQHFLLDVVAGGTIGTGIAIFAAWATQKCRIAAVDTQKKLPQV